MAAHGLTVMAIAENAASVILAPPARRPSRWIWEATMMNVQCLGKGCFANVGRDLTFSYDTEEEAVKAWNRRAGEQDG